MATTVLATRIATGNAQALNTVPAPITKSRKSRLVARWLTDENSKLYCQRLIED